MHPEPGKPVPRRTGQANNSAWVRSALPATVVGEQRHGGCCEGVMAGLVTTCCLGPTLKHHFDTEPETDLCEGRPIAGRC